MNLSGTIYLLSLFFEFLSKAIFEPVLIVVQIRHELLGRYDLGTP
jgi:hypothetical protein